MKRILWTMLVLICLILPASLPAEQDTGDQEEMSEMQITLKEYREDGYEMLGPVQYLGKTRDKIKLYKHGSVSYRLLDSIDESGEKSSVKKNDFVYILSKHGHVVLLRLDREDKSNA